VNFQNELHSESTIRATTFVCYSLGFGQTTDCASSTSPMSSPMPHVSASDAPRSKRGRRKRRAKNVSQPLSDTKSPDLTSRASWPPHSEPSAPADADTADVLAESYASSTVSAPSRRGRPSAASLSVEGTQPSSDSGSASIVVYHNCTCYHGPYEGGSQQQPILVDPVPGGAMSSSSRTPHPGHVPHHYGSKGTVVYQNCKFFYGPCAEAGQQQPSAAPVLAEGLNSGAPASGSSHLPHQPNAGQQPPGPVAAVPGSATNWSAPASGYGHMPHPLDVGLQQPFPVAWGPGGASSTVHMPHQPFVANVPAPFGWTQYPPHPMGIAPQPVVPGAGAGGHPLGAAFPSDPFLRGFSPLRP
jgi:hypothetical protein